MWISIEHFTSLPKCSKNVSLVNFFLFSLRIAMNNDGVMTLQISVNPLHKLTCAFGEGRVVTES